MTNKKAYREPKCSRQSKPVLRALLVILALSTLAIAGISPVGAVDDVVVARGDGFVVTKLDLHEFKRIVESGHFRASEEEHKKAALRTWVFAAEGEALGLGPAPSDDEAGDRGKRVLRKIETSLRYTREVLREHPVSDEAIVAYYRVHPNQKGWEELNEELRTKIRHRMVNVKKMEIMTTKLGPLKEKYNFELVKPGKGGAQ